MNEIGIAIFIVLVLSLWLFLYSLRRKENYRRSLKLCFLKITMPKKDSQLDEKNETTKDFKETIAIMEQLLSSLKSIYSKKIHKKILWQDLISLEYIAHKWDIYFYVVCANNYKDLIEKQINGYYPDAVIEETPEVNIFKWKKYFSWTYLYSAKHFFYPLRTYQKLESDPINNITNAFSKLEEDESAAIQILLKPADDDWQEDCQKASTKIMEWKKASLISFNPLTIIVWIINVFVWSTDKKEEAPKIEVKKEEVKSISVFSGIYSNISLRLKQSILYWLFLKNSSIVLLMQIILSILFFIISKFSFL
mgnify:CR=1 FL=1